MSMALSAGEPQTPPEPVTDALEDAPVLHPAAAGQGLLLPTLEPGAAFLHGADAESPRRDSLRRRTLAAADMLALLGAYGAMWLLTPPTTTLSSDLPFLGVLPLWIVLNKTLRLYDRDANLIHKSTLNEMPTIAHSISLGAGLIYFAGPLVPGVAVHRLQIASFWLGAIVLTLALRLGARTLVRMRTAPERLLLVGSGHVAGLVAQKIAGHREYGAELVGYVDSAEGPEDQEVRELPRLGDVEHFEAVCRDNDVERVVVAFSTLSSESLLDVIRVSKRLRMKITIVPRLFEVIGHNVEIDQIEGMTLLGLRPLNRTLSTRALKRGIDIAGAAAGLLLAAPVLAVAAVAIRLTSPGPVLFAQRRVGRGNREFHMLKLRTMVEGADRMKASLAHLNEVPGGGMFKIARRPARDHGRPAPATCEPRRAPAALERAARRDEPRRPTAARARGGRQRDGLASRQARPHPGSHRPLAGDGPQPDLVPRDDQARLPLRLGLVAVERHQAAAADAPGDPRAPGGVTAGTPERRAAEAFARALLPARVAHETLSGLGVASDRDAVRRAVLARLPARPRRMPARRPRAGLACAEVPERLALLAEAQLDGSRRAQLARHVTACRHCGAVEARLGLAERAYERELDLAPPDDPGLARWRPAGLTAAFAPHEPAGGARAASRWAPTGAAAPPAHAPRQMPLAASWLPPGARATRPATPAPAPGPAPPDGARRAARWVPDGHVVPDPADRDGHGPRAARRRRPLRWLRLARPRARSRGRR